MAKKPIKPIKKLKPRMANKEVAPVKKATKKMPMSQKRSPKATLKRVSNFKPFAEKKPEQSLENTKADDTKQKNNNTTLYVGIGLAALAVGGILIYLKNKR